MDSWYRAKVAIVLSALTLLVLVLIEIVFEAGLLDMWVDSLTIQLLSYGVFWFVAPQVYAKLDGKEKKEMRH